MGQGGAKVRTSMGNTSRPDSLAPVRSSAQIPFTLARASPLWPQGPMRHTPFGGAAPTHRRRNCLAHTALPQGSASSKPSAATSSPARGLAGPGSAALAAASAGHAITCPRQNVIVTQTQPLPRPGGGTGAPCYTPGTRHGGVGGGTPLACGRRRPPHVTHTPHTHTIGLVNNLTKVHCRGVINDVTWGNAIADGCEHVLRSALCRCRRLRGVSPAARDPASVGRGREGDADDDGGDGVAGPTAFLPPRSHPPHPSIPAHIPAHLRINTPPAALSMLVMTTVVGVPLAPSIGMLLDKLLVLACVTSFLPPPPQVNVPPALARATSSGRGRHCNCYVLGGRRGVGGAGSLTLPHSNRRCRRPLGEVTSVASGDSVEPQASTPSS